MSSIEVLPVLLTTTGTQVNEDFIYSLAFYYDDNVTPLSLEGISFSAAIGSLATLTTGNGGCVVSGVDDNILTISEYASSKSTWATGTYPFSLLATDGTYTKDVFTQSTLVVGAPFITYVSPLSLGNNMPVAIATYLPPSIASLLISQSSIAVSELTTSVTITSPGTYVATQTGQTFTLPATWNNLADITIADGTNLTNPNFFVTGKINGSTSTITYGTKYQSHTFRFNPIGATWFLVI